MKKISVPIIITSVALVVSLAGNGYLLYDRQVTAEATLLSSNTYQAEIDKLSAKVQEQTDLLSKQSKLIDELKYEIDRQSEELSEANSLLDILRSRDTSNTGKSSNGLIVLEPLDKAGVPDDQLVPEVPAVVPDKGSKPPIVSSNGLTPEQNAELQAELEAAGAEHGGSTCHESGATPEDLAREEAAGSGGYH